MREIIFRGKCVSSGEWVEGCFVEKKDPLLEPDVRNAFILAQARGDSFVTWFPVDPATVGQFTGLLDKNGKRIFEGDVVRQTFEKTNVIVSSDWGGDEYGEVYGEDTGVVVIIPSKGACIKNPVIHREVNGEITQHNERAKMYKNICSGRCEIIGNIHDNPELLEVTPDE